MATPKPGLKGLNDAGELHSSLQDDPEKTTTLGPHIEDSMASGYVDQSLQLDPAENARLLKRLHWQ